MHTMQASLQARINRLRIERILKRFTRDDQPELVNFVSGVNEANSGAIDDGSEHYGDIQHDKRPDWVKKDMTGWK